MDYPSWEIFMVTFFLGMALVTGFTHNRLAMEINLWMSGYWVGAFARSWTAERIAKKKELIEESAKVIEEFFDDILPRDETGKWRSE